MSEIKLPDGWEMVRLGEFCRVTSGGTPSRKEPSYWDGDIPWVKTGEINYGVISTTEESISKEGLENSSAKLIPAGTLLMAMYGQGVTRGRVAILGIEAALNQACAAIFTPDNVLTDYLFHFLTYNYENTRNLGHGANQKNLNSRLIKSIEFPLPPLPEQRAIAHALCIAQQAREARQRELALERERKAALMEHLFTHGIHGELRKQTNIGELPQSWQVVKLGDVCKVASGGTPSRKKPEYWNGDIPWIKTGQINYKIITETEEYITKDGFENSSARLIPAGTLLMAMYGQGVTRGRVGILGIEATINQACAAIFTSKSVSTDYLFYYLTGTGSVEWELNS